MLQKQNTYTGLVGLAVLCLGLQSSPVLAQNKADTANACLAAIEENDMSRAEELSDEIKSWKNLFGPAVIKSAEECLNQVTGENWTYFTTKSQFLSGDEAKTEQEFIDGAEDRRAAEDTKMERLVCEVVVAEQRLEELEYQNSRIKGARTLETNQAALKACSETYASDKASALLNSVCFELFKEVGVPDTQFDFDFEAFLMAQERLSSAKLNLAMAAIPASSEINPNAEKVAECRELISQ